MTPLIMTYFSVLITHMHYKNINIGIDTLHTSHVQSELHLYPYRIKF